MAARDLRYNFFNSLLKERKASAICVAHHINDLAETMLLNLSRGTGIKGLHGILPRRGNIVRPFLCVSREEIETFLTDRGHSFRQDATNFDTEIKRNRLRINVIPELQKINNAAIFNMQKTANRMADAAIMIEKYVEKQKENITISHQPFISFRIDGIENEYFLYLLLKPFNFSSSQTEQIFDSLQNPKPGKIYSSVSHDLLIDRKIIAIRTKRNDYDLQQSYILPEREGKYDVFDSCFIKLSFCEFSNDFNIPKQPEICLADAEKLLFPLTVRRAKKGDSFIPFGMKQRKLVSDYLTDRKKNLFEKEEQLVVTDYTGKIIWLVNERISDNIRVGCHTKRVVILTLKTDV